MEPVNGFTFLSSRPCLLVPRERGSGATEMTNFHGEFGLGSFGAGSAVWHARIGRANDQTLILNGVAYPQLQPGLAWLDGRAATEAAKTRIDRFAARWAARDDASAVQPATIA